MIKKFIHWIAHLTGSNTGKVISWSDEEFIYVAFECDCGKIDKSTISKIESEKLWTITKKS